MHTWIGYAHPDRLISYPHARYLSACVLMPGRCPPTGAATITNISPLNPTSSASVSNRAAGQNSPRSACSQPKRDKTLPAYAKRPKMRVFWRAGRILSREHRQPATPGEFCHASTPKPTTPGEFCHGKRSEAVMPDDFRVAFSCAAARNPLCAHEHDPHEPNRTPHGSALTPGCARKPLDLHVGGAAHTHIIGPTCRSSGPRAPGAHTQGATQYSQERDTRNHLKPRLSRASKPKSHPKTNTFCPLSPRAPPRTRRHIGHEKSTPEGVLFKNAEPPPVDRTEGGRCAPEGTRTPNLLNRNQMLYPLSYGRFAVWLGISLHALRQDAKSRVMT